MSIQASLYQGQWVRLAPIDHEKDPEIMARWSNEPRYTRMLQSDPVRPRSIAQIKKQLEQIEKDVDEKKNLFYFTVRTLPRGEDTPARLIGFLRLSWIIWNTGGTFIQLGIGSPADWGQGYGQDILRLGINFAFDELNLNRLNADIPEQNTRALRLFEYAGFTHEVRRRQAYHRDGRRWDMLTLGLLRSERVINNPEKLPDAQE